MNRKSFINIKKEEFKKRIFYSVVIFLWLSITCFSIWFLVIFQWNNTFNTINPIVSKIFLIINWFFINTLYCNGIKDFFAVIYYWVYLRKKTKVKIEHKLKRNDYKVLMLYTTCNDFDEKSLSKSINQDYENYDVYILDDSNEIGYIENINNFCEKNRNIKLIRRDNRKGFKAGNINNFLKNTKIKYDFFVLLDSDEVIPNDFISKSLVYFEKNKKIRYITS